MYSAILIIVERWLSSVQGAGSRQTSALASSAGTSAWGTRPVKRTRSARPAASACASSGARREPSPTTVRRRRQAVVARRGRSAAATSSSTPSWLSMLPRKSRWGRRGRRHGPRSPPRRRLQAARCGRPRPARADAAPHVGDLAVGLVGGDHERRGSEGEALEAAQNGGDGGRARTSPRTAPAPGRGGRRRPRGRARGRGSRPRTGCRAGCGGGRRRRRAASSPSAGPVEVGVGDRVLEDEAERGRRRRRQRGSGGPHAADVLAPRLAGLARGDDGDRVAGAARLSASARTRTSCG